MVALSIIRKSSSDASSSESKSLMDRLKEDTLDEIEYVNQDEKRNDLDDSFNFEYQLYVLMFTFQACITHLKILIGAASFLYMISESRTLLCIVILLSILKKVCMFFGFIVNIVSKCEQI
jgi:hypothetical protein